MVALKAAIQITLEFPTISQEMGPGGGQREEETIGKIPTNSTRSWTPLDGIQYMQQEWPEVVPALDWKWEPLLKVCAPN